jgi:hypothetical protein
MAGRCCLSSRFPLPESTLLQAAHCQVISAEEGKEMHPLELGQSLPGGVWVRHSRGSEKQGEHLHQAGDKAWGTGGFPTVTCTCFFCHRYGHLFFISTSLQSWMFLPHHRRYWAHGFYGQGAPQAGIQAGAWRRQDICPLIPPSQSLVHTSALLPAGG